MTLPDGPRTRGDEAAFRRLFDAHMAEVWHFARRRCTSEHDADDVVAETFAVAWRRWDAVPGDGARLGPDGAPSPAAALSHAAGATAEVTSLRATLAQTGNGNERTSEIAVSGADRRVESYGTYADGHAEGSTTVVIDDQITQVALDGTVETGMIDDDSERLHPFAASSAAVVDAVLAGGDVTDLGAALLRGVDARHYRIDLDATTRQALADLDPRALAWFQLDYPHEVTSLEVWVADDLIRRIEITAEASTNGRTDTVLTRVDYFDFNADVTISPLG